MYAIDFFYTRCPNNSYTVILDYRYSKADPAEGLNGSQLWAKIYTDRKRRLEFN